jgi:hypothetical protein
MAVEHARRRELAELAPTISSVTSTGMCFWPLDAEGQPDELRQDGRAPAQILIISCRPDAREVSAFLSR